MTRSIVFLILLGLVTFINLSQAGFVGDDYDQVLWNPVIRGFDNPAKFFTGSTFNSGGAQELRGTYYKPAMTAVFAAVYSVAGPSPMAFHLVQVALAILNAILLFTFLRTLFSPSLSFFGAAVFLVHPANSEAVQYISNYQDVLFMLFGLAALNIEAYRKTASWWVTLAEAALLLLSALSKETGLLFTLIVLAHSRGIRGQWRLWPQVLALGAYVWLRVFVSKVSTVQAHYTPMETADTLTRMLNVPAAVFYYIKNFFFPWPLSLAQHWIYREISFEGFVLPLLGIAAALTFAYFSIRRFGRPAWFFVVWSVLAFGLHSQLLPLDSTVADRWHYLPSIGMLGLILLWLQAYDLHRWPLAPAAAFVIFALAGWTFARNQHWSDEERLLTRDLRHQPDSYAIMSQLGFIMLNQDRTDEACGLLQKSVELAPAWWVNTNNYGVCLFAKGRIDEALLMFNRSINNGQYHLAYENVGKVLIQQKRLIEARDFLAMAIERFPGNGVLRGLMAVARNASN
jgi:tetratricopeptide (TPR) repeat protein